MKNPKNRSAAFLSGRNTAGGLAARPASARGSLKGMISVFMVGCPFRCIASQSLLVTSRNRADAAVRALEAQRAIRFSVNLGSGQVERQAVNVEQLCIHDDNLFRGKLPFNKSFDTFPPRVFPATQSGQYV